MVLEQQRTEHRGADVSRQPPEAGLSSYAFARSLRGFDPEQVSRCLWRLEQDHQATLDRLERAQHEIAELRRARPANAVDVTDGERDLDAADASQVTAVIRLAERTAALIVSEAHAAADRRRIETEQALAHAEQELHHRQRALGAEADQIADLRRRLSGDMSRAAMRLVQIVDGDGGLGPFSEQTGSLLEFAELLSRGSTPARSGEVAAGDVVDSSGSSDPG